MKHEWAFIENLRRAWLRWWNGVVDLQEKMTAAGLKPDALLVSTNEKKRYLGTPSDDPALKSDHDKMLADPALKGALSRDKVNPRDCPPTARAAGNQP